MTVFILSWCGTITNNWWIGNENGEKTYQLNTYRCYKDDIDDCKSNDWEKQWEAKKVTFTKEELNNFKFPNLSEENRKTIIKLNNKVKWNEEILIDWDTATISNKLQSCKAYNISLDITYYDRHSGEKWKLNQYIMDNRIKKLKSFLDGDNSKNLKIKEGDKIKLSFIGTMKENNSLANLKDVIEFYYKTPCISEDTTFTIIKDDVYINNIRWIIDYYYILWESIEKWENKSEVVKNMDELMEKISDEFFKRYWSNSVWTYLLDHFNESLDTNKVNQINIILSDFFFQLSDTDREVLKKRFCTKGSDFCWNDTYEFNLNNVTTKYLDKYFFKNLFTKYIFEEFPSLKNLCPLNSEWEKMDVYLLWIDAIPGLSIQDKIKDYYSNYLLKNCNVYYK